MDNILIQSGVSGAEHQELQVTALADAPQLLVATPFAADGNATAEQPDGAVVTHALPHAAHLPIAPRVQGVVRQSAHRHDRGKSRVQRQSHQTPPQGNYN